MINSNNKIFISTRNTFNSIYIFYISTSNTFNSTS